MTCFTIIYILSISYLFLHFHKIFKEDEWSNVICRSPKVQIFWDGGCTRNVASNSQKYLEKGKVKILG
jgi:hypothetical protein